MVPLQEFGLGALALLLLRNMRACCACRGWLRDVVLLKGAKEINAVDKYTVRVFDWQGQNRIGVL